MDSQKLQSLFKTILFLTALAALAYYFNKPTAPEQPATRVEERIPDNREEHRANRKDSRTTHVALDSRVGFASKQKLTQHYQKHGAEFGEISLEEYLRIAQTLRDRPTSGDLLEHRRADGIATRYEKSTGTFIAFNPDKTIRTCFKPNDGEAYFDRQKNRPY